MSEAGPVAVPTVPLQELKPELRARALLAYGVAAMSLGFAERVANAAPGLDRLAARLQPRVQSALGSRPWLHDTLDGTWLGVPLHPVLTDVPVGAWTAAFGLDAVSVLTGSRAVGNAADGALAMGIAGAVPAAVTGTSDWRDLVGEERRIANVHALLNVAGLSLSIASLVQRVRGRRNAGRALSAFGMAFSGTAAHLGGELSFGYGVRVNQNFAAARPVEFTPVLDEAELSGDAMKIAQLDGTPVLIARSTDGQICAIASTCSHLGGPLAEGSREGDVVTCPWHGSRFNLCSGRVVEGPAVFPQPRYEARVTGGKIALRATSD
jgi:nitrite reductase/ring-hydroxylating ferredoxin subunit/uncharacterized membrane protein